MTELKNSISEYESAVDDDVMNVDKDLCLRIMLLLARQDTELNDDTTNLAIDRQLDVAGQDELLTRLEMNLVATGDIML